ncbi:PIN domain-containing protein [Variovorax paradoxus]|uniref:PIN domain-containing protein n=1 Tax=Variovorax paradoxus TaxID=34073 RepID=UPI003ECC5890
MRTNYVLIDFENLQPELLAAIDLEHFRVMVFIGATQSKVPIDFASKLQRLGTRAEYLRISGSGRNALDFHIAFYLGELLAKDPTAVFHVIAVDGGYDPLIQHLKDRKVFARKYKSIADIPHVKAASSKTLQAKIAFVAASLAERPLGRPATLKTLESTIEGMFPGGLAEGVTGDVVKGLEASGFVVISGTKVGYLDAVAT